MSRYSITQTQYKDKECLLKALCDIGYTMEQIEVHSEPQPLYGYKGDKRKEKANIIIRRKNVGVGSNDVGYVLQPDGTYGAIISDFDMHGFGKNVKNINISYCKYALIKRLNKSDCKKTHKIIKEEDGVRNGEKYKIVSIDVKELTRLMA